MAITYNHQQEIQRMTREYASQNYGHAIPESLMDHVRSLVNKEEDMTTAFKLDLDNNRLTFGTVANGQVADVDAQVRLSSKRGTNPVGGSISGTFLGEVKGGLTLPRTVAHKAVHAPAYNIMVVGTGGTGGYLIRDLSRFIYALKEKGDARPMTIKLIDGDVVEKKNVLRQNFTTRDLGKPKAEVLARRYSNAFGIEINAITQMADYNLLRTLNDQRYLRDGYPANIVIGCVDNNAARREISKYANSVNNVYWIDSGNERKSGQVVLGYGNFARRGGSVTAGQPYPLPSVADYYPEVLKPEEDEMSQEESCAERALQDAQNIFVNMTAAGHTLGFIRQVILEELITINKIEFSIKGVTNVDYLTANHISETIAKTRGA